MMRRARLLAVVATLAAGAIGVISATQTWLTVVLTDGAAEPLLVPGAAALPILTPLSLAVLALGAALSIVGTVVRVIFGALGVLLAIALAWSTAAIAFSPPVSAVASTVSTATGISGVEAVSGLVDSIGSTPWPWVTLVAEVLLAAASAFTLVTARRWRGGADRRYRTTPGAAGSRPADAIDSWDDLSRGEDPTR
jgi:hypothetical protein